MNIIIADMTNTTVDGLNELCTFLQDKKYNNENWLILPKDYGIILDCTKEQLYTIKQLIEKAICEKEKEEIGEKMDEK